MDDRTVLALKDDIQKNRQKIELLEKKVKELEEEEERVLKELERVRNYVVYYGSLVSDMKKRMQGRGNLNLFDFL